MLFEILLNFPFPENVILFTLLVVALIFSLTMHEFAHAYVALLNGDATAKINNRLTLNPIKHLDPIGFLMLVVAGFGFAKPVPINPINFKNQRRGLFTVSIAGVTVNIILAFLSAFFLILINKFATLNMFIFYLGFFFVYLMHFNIILCFFNLLPLFPLDGYNVIVSLTKTDNKFTTFLRKYSLYILIILIGLGVIVSRYPINAPWWRYVDLLGTYLQFFADRISLGFTRFWMLIFGI